MTEMSMERLFLPLVTLLRVSCSRVDRRVEETVPRTVQPGDNVTLHCDVKNELFIIWYRQCSHENQPPLEINYDTIERLAPRYHFIWNSSSESFDLRIENITESDLGIFYCATSFTKVEDKDKIYAEEHYRFGNITTRLKFADSISNSTATCSADPNPIEKWMLVASATAACVLVSVVFSAFSYWLGKRKGLKKSKCKARHSRSSGSENRERQQEEAEQLQYITLQNFKEHRFSRTAAAQNDDSVTYSEVYKKYSGTYTDTSS